MGANKARRAKNLFKSYYVAFDKDQPDIIEKHVYYHPDKGIQKTVYYPGAENNMVTIPEGREQHLPYPATEEHMENTQPTHSLEERIDTTELSSRPQVSSLPTDGVAGDRVDAASAFQRWRQFHLKRTFNQELRRVSEVSRKDEASMAMVEQERAQRQKGLAHALAESASLRAQLCAKEQEIHVLQSQTPAGKAPRTYETGEPSESYHRSDEDLVWINHPNLQPQNQNFAAMLRHLAGEVAELEHQAGDNVSFSELHEALRNIDARLRRRHTHTDVRRQAENEFLRRNYRRTQYAHMQPRRTQESMYTYGSEGKFERVGKAVVWKWRWALAVSKAKSLSRHLKNLKLLYKAQLARNMNAEAGSSTVSGPQEYSFRGSMEKTLMNTLPSFSLVTFIVALWRAYASCTKTQKVFLSRLIPIDKIMAAFPVWIEKNGDKQVLEYFFMQWQFIVSRRARHSGGLSVSSPRRSSPRRRHIHEPGPSIYESFHHCCHPSSPTEASRCSPVRVRSPRPHTPRSTTRHRTPRRRKEQEVVCEEENNRGTPSAPPENIAEVSKPPLECVSNNEGSPQVSSFEPLGATDLLPKPVPSVPLTGQTFSAHALRRLQLQLQHELQDMQPILARATKAIQNQVVDHTGKCANSLASLWKVCSTVEYALTEARNQMLSIIQDSARGYQTGFESDDHHDRYHPEGVTPYHDVVEMEHSSRRSCGFPNVFSLISKTSGLHNLRKKSCLAAQYAVGLNHRIRHLQDHPERVRTWQT